MIAIFLAIMAFITPQKAYDNDLAFRALPDSSAEIDEVTCVSKESLRLMLREIGAETALPSGEYETLCLPVKTYDLITKVVDKKIIANLAESIREVRFSEGEERRRHLCLIKNVALARDISPESFGMKPEEWRETKDCT
jgi:hypothetical protein